MNDPKDQPIDIAEQRDWLMEHKKDTGATWKVLAARTGIKEGTLSLFAGNHYNAPGEHIAEAIFRYRQTLAAQAALKGELPEIPSYYETETSKQLLYLLSWAQRGRIVAAALSPGCCKTMTAEHYKACNANVFLMTASPGTASLTSMMNAVLQAFGQAAMSYVSHTLSKTIKDRVRNIGKPPRKRPATRSQPIPGMPEEADEHIAWANEQLRENKLPQVVILAEFNERLVDIGLKPISKGAFSRWSVRAAIEARKLEASRRITDAVLSRMNPGDRTDNTLAAVELLKFRIMEMVTDTEQPDPKFLGAAALALSRLSSTALREAQGQRLDRQEQREETEREKAEAEKAAIETADTVEKIATEAGLSADRVAAIRRGVLGLAV